MLIDDPSARAANPAARAVNPRIQNIVPLVVKGSSTPSTAAARSSMSGVKSTAPTRNADCHAWSPSLAREPSNARP